MENNETFISSLKGLARIVNNGQRGYKTAAKATCNPELKYVFLDYVAQRAMYEKQLKILFEYINSDAFNREEAIAGTIDHAWKAINEAVIVKCDTALLWAVTTGEHAALEKFDLVIQNTQLDQDHLNLLTNQRNEIAGAIKRIDYLRRKYSN